MATRVSGMHARGAELAARAAALMPGGVSSPVRAFRAVGSDPLVIVEGRGPYVIDADGREYVDLIASWGPLVLGHAHPDVVAAITEQARRGTSYGMTSPLEAELAERIVSAMPSVEMLRFTSSGTEAAMSALRVARAATGRAVVVKFAGCYHGHADALLVAAGSGVATFGLPDSAGVTEGMARDTLVARYNDLRSVSAALAARPGAVAAVIVEPVAANMGVVLPHPGFLEGLRALCDEMGALLVFDEVITGFRLARGGAQERYGVRADLTVLGKIVGGGLPVAAYGGRRDLMERVAPLGDVYQAGTLSGNPLAMAAGIVTLDRLDVSAYERLEAAGRRLADGLAAPGVTVQRAGSLLTPFFNASPVRDHDEARRSDTEAFGRFHRAMRERGVLLPPSQFEALFVGLAHDDGVLDRVAAAARGSYAEALA